jgi:hypothetical protein
MEDGAMESPILFVSRDRRLVQDYTEHTFQNIGFAGAGAVREGSLYSVNDYQVRSRRHGGGL